MKNIPGIGVQIPQVYLPKPGIDLTKWAVIACDQYTSQPDYWDKVENFVGTAPSTLRMTLPEIYLEDADVVHRIESVHSTMKKYHDEGIVQPSDGMIYVERRIGSKTRRGIVLALDLERYDYNKGSKSLIRATEGTIVDRLPPRMRIREKALFELPHILVLIDDPNHTVIAPLGGEKSKHEKVYDFDLMQDGGHLSGYRVVDPGIENEVITALQALAEPGQFSAKYGAHPDAPILLFAMGDGNHSLATAKAIWEKIRAKVGMDHPARYALVEIENVHDEALEFEPIHRVLFNVKKDFFEWMKSGNDGGVSITKVSGESEMIEQVDRGNASRQRFGLISPGPEFEVGEFTKPSSNLAVGTLQPILDLFVAEGGAEKIDYVHGADVTVRLGRQQGNLGIYLPGMHKSELFKTVILDGALPRKTFSMGEAHEKRFYMEARKMQQAVD